MKKLMNLTKLAITALVTSSLFVACSEEISENTVDTQYAAQTGNISNAGQAVDLGLPSGTLWANKNVGASSESDNGILFIWGDITGKKIDADHGSTYTNVTEATSMAELFNAFSHETRDDGQICDTTNIAQISQSKLIDTSSLTDPDEIQEAITDFLKAKLEDAKKSATGKGMLEATLVNDGSWTVILNLDGSEYGDVRVPDKQTWDQYKFEKVTSVTIDEIVITPVKYQFSWNANNYAEVKDIFGKVMYKDYTGGTIGNSIKDITDPKKNGNLTFVPAYNISFDAKHDAATANWGNGWKMPTTAQLAELMNLCEWEFVGSGYKVTGPNGKSIFLPAAGYRYGDKQYGKGNAGYYASGEIIGTYSYPSMAAQYAGSQGDYSSKENMPSVLIFQQGQYNTIGVYNNMSATYGFSIRPVANLLK
jgi:hypothetical protein